VSDIIRSEIVDIRKQAFREVAEYLDLCAANSLVVGDAMKAVAPDRKTGQQLKAKFKEDARVFQDQAKYIRTLK